MYLWGINRLCEQDISPGKENHLASKNVKTSKGSNVSSPCLFMVELCYLILPNEFFLR
ncbi:hypothetical protein SPPR111872_08120 [Sphingobacterium prati]